MAVLFTIDRGPGGLWVLVEVATGEVVGGPFRSRVEAEVALSDLRVSQAMIARLGTERHHAVA